MDFPLLNSSGAFLASDPFAETFGTPGDVRDFDPFALAAAPPTTVFQDLMNPAARAFWNEHLLQLPCVFGRLVLMHQLCDTDTGRYCLLDLQHRFGPHLTDRGLRATHMQVFWEWLEFSLEDKRGDLALYLGGLPGDNRVVARSWLALRPFQLYFPHDSTDAERELYLLEFDVVLDILRQQFSL